MSEYSYSFTMEASEHSRNSEKGDNNRGWSLLHGSSDSMFKGAIRRLEGSVRVWGPGTEKDLTVHWSNYTREK